MTLLQEKFQSKVIRYLIKGKGQRKHCHVFIVNLDQNQHKVMKSMKEIIATRSGVAKNGINMHVGSLKG